MKIILTNTVVIFLIAGLIYLVSLVGAMNLFCVKDAEGFFSDKDFLLFGFLYQIPISLTVSLIYSHLAKKITGVKTKTRKLVQMNIPLLWFPLAAIQYAGLYWIKTEEVIQTEEGRCIDRDGTEEDESIN